MFGRIPSFMGRGSSKFEGATLTKRRVPDKEGSVTSNPKL